MEFELKNPLKPLARPAYKLTLTQQNKDITSTIAQRLISLQVTDNRGLAADDLTLVLDDSDKQLQMPTRDAILKVSIGYQGEELTCVGEFQIDQVKHEGPPDRLTLVGRSAHFSDSFNTLQETSWHDMTLGEIVQCIASRNKVGSSVPSALQQIRIAHIDQTQESDASFLHRLAVRNGAALAFKRGKVMLVKPGRGQGPDGTTFVQAKIARSDGDQHSYEVADRVNYTGVIARWLDTKAPKNQMQQVKLQCKPAEPESAGVAHPQSQTAPAPEKEEPALSAGQKENAYIISTVFANKEEAQNAAKAFLQKIQSQAAKFTLTLALGRPDITAETPVRVTGFNDAINNTSWVIAKVIHVMNNTGFISKLELETKVVEGQYDAQQS